MLAPPLIEAPGGRIAAVRLFDSYLFVDYSARSAPSNVSPSADAVWIGEARAGGPGAHYFRTRAQATTFLRERLRREISSRRRTLVGCDFSYGYPAGFARALNLAGPAWSATSSLLAALVVDGADNRNNRYEVAARLNALVGGGAGPFWGRPAAWRDAAIAARSPGFPFRSANGVDLERLRLTEERLRGVQETWKLHGRGSVGGQTLLGIPWLWALRHAPDLAGASRVWPFETRFRPPRARPGRALVLYAEIWPSLVEAAAPVRPGGPPIRDAQQVLALCRWARAADASGALAALLAAPRGLGREGTARALAEEGWILGVR